MSREHSIAFDRRLDVLPELDKWRIAFVLAGHVLSFPSRSHWNEPEYNMHFICSFDRMGRWKQEPGHLPEQAGSRRRGTATGHCPCMWTRKAFLSEPGSRRHFNDVMQGS